MDKIGLKRFFYFQFVSKDNVKDVFRLTLYKSKPNKLLIFNGVIKIKRLGRVYPRVRIRSLSSGRFFKSGFPKWLKMRLSDWNCKQVSKNIQQSTCIYHGCLRCWCSPCPIFLKYSHLWMPVLSIFTGVQTFCTISGFRLEVVF